jgi:hypothetical protein
MKPLPISFPRYLSLYILSLSILLGVAAFQDTPGYMDAEYYQAGGFSINTWLWQEPFIWNYLDDPAGLPHQGFSYWMPLASLLATAGMFLTGSLSFSAGRLGFILLAAAIAPLTAGMAYRLHPDRRSALVAGLLAVCSGFYLPYLPTTDTFGLVMLLGGAFLLTSHALAREVRHIHQIYLALLLGLLAGLMYLGRADGILWLGIGSVAVVLLPHSPWRWSLLRLGALLMGALLVIAPWMARNQAVFGTFFSPAGLRPLWITTYDQLYSYPASLLTQQNWLASGLPALIAARMQALGTNLQSLLAVQGQIFLLPLMLVGLWHLRREWMVQIGVLVWTLILGVMTLVFPFQGWRGGYFHSVAALQPLLWAVTPLGLNIIVGWAAQRRKWNTAQALRTFEIGLVIMAAGFTLLVTLERLNRWNVSAEQYARIGTDLDKLGLPPGAPVFVNNPPGFTLAAHRPSLAVPDGAPETLLAVARRYGACWVLLEPDHPHGLDGLYVEPGLAQDLPLITRLEDTYLLGVADCTPELLDMSLKGTP